MVVWAARQYNGAFEKTYAQCERGLRNKVDRRFAQLMEKGTFLPGHIIEHLEGPIWELKADAKRIRVRFLFFFGPGELQFTVLSGHFKDQRTLPRRHIERARRLYDEAVADYFDGITDDFSELDTH